MYGDGDLVKDVEWIESEGKWEKIIGREEEIIVQKEKAREREGDLLPVILFIFAK